MRPSVAIQEVAEDLEGGEFTADPEPTRYGIVQSVYDAYRSLRLSPPRSVAKISMDEVVQIYSGNYWGPLRASQLPDGVDFVVFQMGVNIGIGRAARILQAAVGAYQDGVIGPQTIAAAAKKSPSDLVDQLLQAQDDYYDGLLKANPARNAQYIDGWHNRVRRVRLFLATGLTEGGALGVGSLLLLLLLGLGLWGAWKAAS